MCSLLWPSQPSLTFVTAMYEDLSTSKPDDDDDDDDLGVEIIDYCKIKFD